MRRAPESYRRCVAHVIANGSTGQMIYFIEDAKADIAALAPLVERLAKMKPGEQVTAAMVEAAQMVTRIRA